MSDLFAFPGMETALFSSSTYGGTVVPINIRTAGVETRIGFSYSVTQQPAVVTWQHSSLKPVSPYCKAKYGTHEGKLLVEMRDVLRRTLISE
jgi:hypothetical protein